MSIFAAALLAVGLLLIAVCGLLLRSLGSAWKVARVLGSARDVALGSLDGHDGEYVRTHGRIGSDEEFPDDLQRPLVFRRTRLQQQGSRGQWLTLHDDRLAVPFWIEERGAALTIDTDALGDGLVVVPRIAEGVASELPPELAQELREPLPGSTPVRVRIDQVSAVEHATVAGMIEAGPHGRRVTAGHGRPLILTTVEPDAAMRLLASERRPRVIAAAMLLALALGSFAAALVSVLVTGT